MSERFYVSNMPLNLIKSRIKTIMNVLFIHGIKISVYHHPRSSICLLPDMPNGAVIGIYHENGLKMKVFGYGNQWVHQMKTGCCDIMFGMVDQEYNYLIQNEKNSLLKLLRTDECKNAIINSFSINVNACIMAI